MGLIRRGPFAVCVFLLAGCAAAPPAGVSAAQDNTLEGRTEVADLYVVDCLLPGTVRMLGNRPYITPRRPARTTAADCRVRGGEYEAYDRADYRSALNVWMPAANRGDPEAQTNVGEIFERGLGGAPNYEAARIWYEKAAAQGSARAQFNLGTLYELGLGVEQDRVAAMNWYRKSWGLEEDALILASVAEQEQEALRERLEQQIDQKDAQIELLRQQLSEMQGDARQTSEQVDALRSLIAQLETARQEESAKLASLPQATAPADPATEMPAPADEAFRPASPREMNERSFGRYYALLVGNQNYQHWDDLESPWNNVNRARQILEERYGFSVQVIADDPDGTMLLSALNDLNEMLTEDDNLLIFYSGHGAREQVSGMEMGFWLPVASEPPPRDTHWLPTEAITRHLYRLKAKRILVIADSCYAGLLSSGPDPITTGMKEDLLLSERYVELKLPKKSRLLLSSGGDSPVMDAGGDGYSVFASALLEELSTNTDVLGVPALFLRIRQKVSDAAAASDFEQSPAWNFIRAAGSEPGDFFFVPNA
ncbi:MAG: caspase family protein [Gammaproteobacteria bacterium]